MDTSNISHTITEMLTTYHELNGNIDELLEDPSPLDFMRYVAKNRPFVVRRGCSTWPAVQTWNAAYLQAVMRETPVKIAVTPYGNADSAVRNPQDGSIYFCKPLELDESFSDFLSYLRGQSSRRDSLVKYSQTQNDNLRGEYAPFYKDVERDIRWASIALDRKPDAINLWVGNGQSTTALHRDNYENIYAQIVGSKHFVLLPPIETACVNEQFLPCATYAADMSLVPDTPNETVPFAVWDPDRPDEHMTRFSHLSKPIRVKLDPGDMLYLPTCWYHKVSQKSSEEGICCSINYWYDMDLEGTFHASNIFVRNVAWTGSPVQQDRRD
ncbi:hypothetical protein MMC28_004000 [Mycoblastus sanguinarius]|nr:hypothetical protein [Mycoblastus sanguinarius]